MNKQVMLLCLLLLGSVSFSHAQSKKEMKEEIVRLKEETTQLTTENENLDAALHQAQAQNDELRVKMALQTQELATVDFRIQELLRENETLRGQISPKAQRKLKKRSQQAQLQPRAQ